MEQFGDQGHREATVPKKKTGTSVWDQAVPGESKGYFGVNTLCHWRQDMRTVALALSEAAFGCCRVHQAYNVLRRNLSKARARWSELICQVDIWSRWRAYRS